MNADDRAEAIAILSRIETSARKRRTTAWPEPTAESAAVVPLLVPNSRTLRL